MHHRHKLFALACSVFLALIGGCKRPDALTPASAGPDSIIPAPRELTAADGQFVVTQDTVVSFESGSAGEAAARYLVDVMKRTRNLSLRTNPSAAPDAK